MKQYITLLAMLATGPMLFGQNGLEWGVKGGLTYNMSELGLSSAVSTTGEVFSGERSNNGWHLGMSVRDEVTKNFYVQFDGLYNQSAFRITGTDGQGNEVQEDLLQRSVQMNLTPGIKLFRFVRVQGGLNGNLWLDREYVDTFGRFHLGYQLGVGVDLGPMTLDLGYNASFKDHKGEWNGIPLSSDRGELLMSVGILL